MAGTEAIAVVFPKLEFPPASGYSKSDSTKPPAATKPPATTKPSATRRRYVLFYFIVQIQWRPTISFEYISEDEEENSY